MLLPIGFQGFAMTLWIFGFVANAFFVVLLWRHVSGWAAGKALLFTFHVSALTYMAIKVVSVGITFAQQSVLSSRQCAPVVPLQQMSTLFIPLSLGVTAAHRWRTVRSKLLADDLVGKPEPKVLHYILGLTAGILLLVIAFAAVGATSDVPVVWDERFLTCQQMTPLYRFIFMLSFFGPAPVMLYCYWRIIKTFRAVVGGITPNDDVRYVVRVFITLSVLYYCTHMPFLMVALAAEAVEIPVPLFAGLGLLQTAYSAVSPALSIVLTPRYLSLSKAILSGNSISTGTGMNLVTTKNSNKGSANESVTSVSPNNEPAPTAA